MLTCAEGHNDAFIILDEAQNTTIAQMKMFLTRIGFRSRTVVTGDVSQVDLSEDTKSGLIDCLEFVEKIKGVKITNFESSDVVRHRIVRDIINAYDKRKSKNLRVCIIKDDIKEYIQVTIK